MWNSRDRLIWSHPVCHSDGVNTATKLGGRRSYWQRPTWCCIKVRNCFLFIWLKSLLSLRGVKETKLDLPSLCRLCCSYYMQCVKIEKFVWLYLCFPTAGKCQSDWHLGWCTRGTCVNTTACCKTMAYAGIWKGQWKNALLFVDSVFPHMFMLVSTTAMKKSWSLTIINFGEGTGHMETVHCADYSKH